MNEIKILQHVLRELQKERKSYEASCSSGAPKDFSEYKHLCGVIQGLGLAESFVNDLVQKLERDDD